ncbi:Deubiquitinating enzyme MINDY-3/4 like protein [Aduncisulcus paluster]|uniref:Probable ubiquitin carboxyl-terminal hydrolase MINDY-4 n=1 Tax=Aduncisulcus paluster TaxID=2918883 RepID=A0ABQ5K5W7_9EUKA|nr:Deubiquitinating enzyme MINDY-3/4 like protein [Aduncisulcus paluster]
MSLQALTTALLREYLHANGCTETLKMFDSEVPRSAHSISSRKQMLKTLHLTKAFLLNLKAKKMGNPSFETILEVLISEWVQHVTSSGDEDMSQKSPIPDKEASIRPSPPRSPPKTPPRRVRVFPSSSAQSITSSHHVRESSSNINQATSKKISSFERFKRPSSASSSKYVTLGRSVVSTPSQPFSELLRKQTSMKNFKKILFGGVSEEFPISWFQSFPFVTPNPSEAWYGLLQQEGGPCGYLAVLQARVIRHAFTKQRYSSGLSSYRDVRWYGSSCFSTIPTDVFVSSDGDAEDYLCAQSITSSHHVRESSSNINQATSKKISSFERFKRPSSASSSKYVTLGRSVVSTPSQPFSELLRKQTSMKNFKKILFGGVSEEFPISWFQSFPFVTPNPSEAWYGLLQQEGGPCGYLAVLQARVIRHAFTKQRYSSGLSSYRDVRNAQVNLLVRALADTLCICSGCEVSSLPPPESVSGEGDSVSTKNDMLRSSVIIVLPSNPGSDSVSSPLSSPEMYVCHTVRRYSALCRLLYDVKENLVSEGQSDMLICMCVSSVLSCGIKNIEAARKGDAIEDSLIAEHGYCSQALVNMLISGRAAPHTHKGVQNIGELLLNGVTRAGDICFIPHSDCLGYTTTCDELKYGGVYPAWVILHESHYSVLFGKDITVLDEVKGVKQVDDLDLFYYDQQNKTPDIIHLTVETAGGLFDDEEEERDDDSFINQLIRILLPGCGEIDWHGEMLLL